MIGCVGNIRQVPADLPAETALLLFVKCELSGRENELKEDPGKKGSGKQIAEIVFCCSLKTVPVAACERSSCFRCILLLRAALLFSMLRAAGYSQMPCGEPSSSADHVGFIRFGNARVQKMDEDLQKLPNKKGTIHFRFSGNCIILVPQQFYCNCFLLIPSLLITIVTGFAFLPAFICPLVYPSS